MSEDSPRPIGEHLEELRSRLIVCLGAVGAASLFSFVWAREIVAWLSQPVEEAVRCAGMTLTLAATSPVEVFWVAFKAAILVGLGAAFPVILYEVFRFAHAGLRPGERRLLYPFLGVGAALFYAGAGLAYRFLMPWMFGIFLASQREFGVTPLWTIENTLTVEVLMLLACGLLSEIPLAMAVLGKLGILTPAFFRGKWRIVIFLSAALSAWITPTGDPFTMLAVTVLLLAFVGVGWLSLWIFAKC